MSVEDARLPCSSVTLSSLVVVEGSQLPPRECPDNPQGHCWHSLGTGIQYYTGGQTDHRCCNCGARWSRPWHEETRRAKGHGPYASETVAVWDEEPRYPDDPR